MATSTLSSSPTKSQQQKPPPIDPTPECPIEEVALVVPETDDPTLPVMTFRAWFLGITSCTILIFLNTFFTYRTQPLSISAVLMQIAVLPIGRFMAAVLPNRDFRVFGGKLGFNLNPGPFNMKEHVIITVFANCGVSSGGGDAYSIGAITVMKTYYKQGVGFLCSLLIVLTTQVWVPLMSDRLVQYRSIYPLTDVVLFEIFSVELKEEIISVVFSLNLEMSIAGFLVGSVFT